MVFEPATAAPQAVQELLRPHWFRAVRSSNVSLSVQADPRSAPHHPTLPRPTPDYKSTSHTYRRQSKSLAFRLFPPTPAPRQRQAGTLSVQTTHPPSLPPPYPITASPLSRLADPKEAVVYSFSVARECVQVILVCVGHVQLPRGQQSCRVASRSQAARCRHRPNCAPRRLCNTAIRLILKPWLDEKRSPGPSRRTARPVILEPRFGISSLRLVFRRFGRP